MILLDMAVKVLSLPLYHKISFNKRTKKKRIITSRVRERSGKGRRKRLKSIFARSEAKAEEGGKKFFALRARNHLLKASKLK
jgi:hypothetical protein